MRRTDRPAWQAILRCRELELDQAGQRVREQLQVLHEAQARRSALLQAREKLHATQGAGMGMDLPLRQALAEKMAALLVQLDVAGGDVERRRCDLEAARSELAAADGRWQRTIAEVRRRQACHDRRTAALEEREASAQWLARRMAPHAEERTWR